jgi:hypothetical protein
MICVLPFCAADETEMRQWLAWNHRLGGTKNHSVLIVADDAVKFDIALEFIASAKLDFKDVSIITNGRTVVGWPQGPNSAFSAAAKHIKDLPGDSPWFWCEPDCIPLKANWLDALDAAYASCGRKFMGAIMTNQHPHPALPDVHLAGCAVYPHDAWSIIGGYCNGDKAWDMASSATVVPLAANTPLIQNFWGQPKLPPTFALAKTPTSPENTFTMRNVNREAVVFHRNKDGTLIRLLWRSLFGDMAGENREFIVVIPYHNGDAPLTIQNLKWQIRMGQEQRYDCLLATSKNTINQFQVEIATLATKAYRRVDNYLYQEPPQNRWPQAANHVFQCVARFMQHADKRPWLWAEPDLVPLCKEWLDVLQAEYMNCGKPIMGSIVPVMGHMNGTGVYPANFSAMSPRAMASNGGAFDTDMKQDIEGKVHDVSHLMQHAWGIMGGRVHHCAGPAPTFRTPNDIGAWVKKGAVTFHRCKDGTLIKVLESMKI